MQDARPPLWRVQGGHSTVYLFGSLHQLPSQTRWYSEPLQAIVGQCSELVFEVADSHAEAAANAAGVAGRLYSSTPVLERLPASHRSRYHEVMLESELDEAKFDHLQPVIVALAIGHNAMTTAGLIEQNGVEPTLRRAAGQHDLAVGGLETTMQLVGAMADIAPEEQLKMLVATLDNVEQVKTFSQQLVSGWTSGDVPSLESDFQSLGRLDPSAAEHLVVARNRRWAEALHQRLEEPADTFVAVGIGHLIGPDSVQQQLRAIRPDVTICRVDY